METNQHKFISLNNLGMAYRKAKVDAFYSTIPIRNSFLAYEKDLVNNLRRFQEQLQSDALDIDLGGWTLVPQKIGPKNDQSLEPTQNCTIFADSQHQWDCFFEQSKAKAEFRLMAQPSVTFHILSALWIAKVGYKYDATLLDSACGNRLRRKKDGEINAVSLGSFVPYMKPFKDWRDNGIRSMRVALESKKKIIALTADVKSFYHELNPDFLLDERFLDEIGMDMNDRDRWLTELFILSLKKWSEKTPLKKGLPVGLPASSVVANMALFELDRLIEQEIVPLYYGRYVDDVIIVMENNAKFRSSDQVWEWIFKRANGLLTWKNEQKKENVCFVPVYLLNSQIQFSNRKNKVFVLEANTGLAMVNSIDRQIRKRSSEWRALPCLPKKPEHVSTDLLSATQKDGESADNLRKTDVLSLRRAAFAIKLRDFEAYARDLPPEAWQKHRHAFFNAVIEHVLTLPIFFDLSIYLPRILRMATGCADFQHLRHIIDRLDELVGVITEKCTATIKACAERDCPPLDEIVKVWQSNLQEIIKESIQAAFPYRLSKSKKTLWQKHFGDDLMIAQELGFSFAIRYLQVSQRDLFIHDLADFPFRFVGLPKEMVGYRAFPPKKESAYLVDADIIVNDIIIKGAKLLQQWMKIPIKDGLLFGLVFATRPFNVQELYLLHSNPLAICSQDVISEVILAIRGFRVEGKMPCVEKNGLIHVPLQATKNQLRIALASWKTKGMSWRAAVKRKADPDFGRYQRLTSLVNGILRSSASPGYVIFPELSVPAVWFLRIAQKLHGKGISLICGVEYLHRRGKKVSNQIWAALRHDGLGFPSLAIIRQDKQRPAMHEEQELFRLAGLRLIPQTKWLTPLVIRHGNFKFAMLVCSELTNIAYRAALRGKIDALFVPEWNQDTETFNALIESAALDIHAFIVQCNDSQYGDSRIRAPYKKSWKRDVVRIKGGTEDYFVIGEINITSLRAFQSSHRSPSGPFKPVPDGFEISCDREKLPLDDKHELRGS